MNSTTTSSSEAAAAADATSSISSIAGGLALIILAGILNGSWNASFSPKIGCAVGRTTTTVQVLAVGRRATVLLGKNGGNVGTAAAAAAVESGEEGDGVVVEDELQHSGNNDSSKKVLVDLNYHYAWLLFQLYAALVNIPLCIYWTGGPERTLWIMQQTSHTSIALVCLFSLLWGVGSVGFGLACKVAGLGLGTNLTMGVIMMAGTLLPLILQNLVTTKFGAVILVGLGICSIGLGFSMSSLQIRDADEKKSAAAAAKQCGKIPETSKPGGEVGAEVAATSEPDINNNMLEDHQQQNGGGGDEQQQQHQGYSTLSKVLLCVISGLFASMLQFAFVYGDPMIQLSASSSSSSTSNEDGPGSTPQTGTASIVWLFAFTISCPVSIVYGLVSSPKHIPLSTIWKCPWYRHVLLFLTSTLPWVAHIHLYGIANNPLLLPPRLAATVSWPVLMMTTVATGMIWSLGLGEWNEASAAAKRQLTISLCTITAGIVMLMASLAVAESSE
jgi:hypothetical protein